MRIMMLLILLLATGCEIFSSTDNEELNSENVNEAPLDSGSPAKTSPSGELTEPDFKPESLPIKPMDRQRIYKRTITACKLRARASFDAKSKRTFKKGSELEITNHDSLWYKTKGGYVSRTCFH